MIINFLNQYYKNRSQDQNASDLVNMYLEEDQSLGKYKVVAFPTPGLSSFNSGSGSLVRGGIEHKGIAYFVVDNTFYSYASDGTRTSRGTLNTSTGSVQLTSISNQIGIVDGTNIYIYNTNTNTLTTVTDPDAPSNPATITAQDEFFLVGSSNSNIVYGSDIADGSSWSALSFNTKTGPGDYVVRVISNRQFIYVLGEYISNVWYNSGAATFSFETVGLGSYFHYGCAARHSVASGNNTIIFLGQSKHGGYQVLTMDQYDPKPVSTRAIEYQLNNASTVSDAIGYCYRKSGHEFYVLILPTAGLSFQYDFTTGLWSELQSYVNSVYTRHLSNCHVFCYGKNLVGSYNSGNIYYLNDSVYTDNGAQILRRIVSPPGYLTGKKVFLDKLQIDVETGVGSTPNVTLEISKDSGHSFANSYTGTIPASGGRLFWNRLGMTQNAFVIRLTTTANAKFIVLGAIAEIRKGLH